MTATTWRCPEVVTNRPAFDPSATERPCPYVGTLDEVARHLRDAHYLRGTEATAWRRDVGVGEDDEG